MPLTALRMRWNAVTWRGEIWRGNLRLGSGLVLLAFVICHLTAHAFLLISFESADAALAILMAPWRTIPGTVLLAGATLVHYLNALWAIYVRRTLRFSRWEWTQLALGLAIPPLLMLHVISTRIADVTMGVTSYYSTVLLALWLPFPWLSFIQAVAVLTVWVHSCIGIHFWWRTKVWYPQCRPFLFVIALLLPALALAGYVTGGNQVLREARNPQYVKTVQQESHVTQATEAANFRITDIGWTLYAALTLLPFAARSFRGWRFRRRHPPRLTHANGRIVTMHAGATVLETLRENGIPQAAVCGGRGRCTTCRVLVTKGLDELPAPTGLEAKALERIGATPGMRLACQIRPTADISIMPLLTADARALDGTVRGGLEGRERLITVVFVDMRDSTALAEAKLPFDVLYILNQFFHEMTDALNSTNGHYSQFTGDGLMALYGLHATDPAAGAADAVRGAHEMLTRLDQLNYQLEGDLPAPLRIGIGIHYSTAIVGAMGPPRSRIITAIGDTVNTCARLESLTKDYGALVIISRQAAEAAGLDLTGHELHQAPVKGRQELVQFYVVKSLDDLKV